MRTANLVKVGVQAEALRLRQMADRTAYRAAFAAVAVVFIVAAIAALHVAGAMYLATMMPPADASLVVAGIDVVIAAIFGVVALTKGPGQIEREALAIRQTAQAQIGEAVAMTALVGPVARMVGGRKLYALTLAALTARYLGGAR